MLKKNPQKTKDVLNGIEAGCWKYRKAEIQYTEVAQ